MKEPQTSQTVSLIALEALSMVTALNTPLIIIPNNESLMELEKLSINSD